MKLGIFVPNFPTQTHIFFWREIKALEKLGVEVEILSTKQAAPDECPHPFRGEAVSRTHYVYPPQIASVLSSGFRNISGLFRTLCYIAGLKESSISEKFRVLAYSLCAADLATFCRKLGIAHIHVHSCAEAAHIVAIARLLGGPSYSLHLHGDLPVYGVDHAAKMKHAKFVSAAARPMQQQVIDEIGLAENRTYTIWMGVETSRFDVIDHEKKVAGPTKLITVARLSRTKGHVYALAALRKAVDQGADIDYSIVGSGPYREEIVKAINKYELNDRVKLLGSLGEEAVKENLLSSDIFILSSIEQGEASPVSVMEAMACGLPVICSIIGGTPDMIEDRVSGILVQQKDVQGLGDALFHLHTNREERGRMGMAARKRAVELFDVTYVSKKTLEAIRAHQGLEFIPQTK